MPSITTLLSRLKADYPQYIFKSGDDFYWSSSDNTIFYNKNNKEQLLYLFHELSHAVLDHRDYSSDIELITMERQAWDMSKDLAKKYGFNMDDEFVQTNLDSYRDWLHSRSTCPSCEATGLQDDAKSYRCLECGQNWRVNDAKMNKLRRYKEK